MWTTVCNYASSPKTKSRLLALALAVCLACVYYYYIVIVGVFKSNEASSAATPVDASDLTNTTTPTTTTPTPTKKPGVDTDERVTFTVDDFEVGGQMGHLEVVTDLRENYLVPPPAPGVPYNLTSGPGVYDPSAVQAFLVSRILNGKRDGFFVECGAYDGEHMSNTLMFEREYNWTGLLIEPSPPLFTKLKSKNRKAYISHTCLSSTRWLETMEFADADVNEDANVSAKVVDNVSVNVSVDDVSANVSVDDVSANVSVDDVGVASNESVVIRSRRDVQDEGDAKVSFTPIKANTTVQCFPFYSYLLAMNRRLVHYLSLNVAGRELEVVKTIPWERTDIRTLSVSFSSLEPGDRQELRVFMEGVGFYLHSEVKIGTHHHNDDYIFVKRNVER